MSWTLRDIRRTYRWMAWPYDRLFRRGYQGLRQESLKGLSLRPDATVLLVGVGTGLDLRFVPPAGLILAVDLSPAMLRRAAQAPASSAVDALIGDGARLPFPDASVSAAIFHLVLCSAPGGRALLQEAARVLEPGAPVAILDHFAPRGPMRKWRRLASRYSWVLGTHLDRRFEPMLQGLPFEVQNDKSLAGGYYRAIRLRRR